MWKATIGANLNSNDADDGDWETDPDFINNVTEQEQRWGSKTVEGSGRTIGAIDMSKLREETTKAYELQKQKQKENAPNASYGYGGKFGIEKDRMDKSAVGHDYIAKVEKHMSQTDYNTGFGGKFGVQTDRVDKSAVSWDHKENIEKHGSQKDYSSGFGGKFGVEKDKQDKSAVGWDHLEKLHQHDSQTVGKRDNIIIEQTQKPSQLKAKFENLAKQNEIKPVERKKIISLPKVSEMKSYITSSENSNPVQNITVGKQKEEAEESQKIQRDNLEEEDNFHKAMKIQTVQEEKQQELLKQKKEQELLAQQQKEELSTEQQQQELFFSEPASVVTTETHLQENKDNSSVALNEEQIYEQVDCFTAVALYDYQAAADDEISFDPDDIITNIEKIDEGWWRGTCHGQTGLFPANYVQLKE